MIDAQFGMSERNPFIQRRKTVRCRTMDKARSRITGPHCDLPVVSTVQEAARKTIQQPEITRRSIEDQQSFAEAPLKPPKPNAALKRAFKRHAKLIAPE